MTPENVILTGDCVEVMAGFDAESVDAIVCDPPYGLEFMDKSWDKLGAGIEDVTEGTDDSHPFRDGTRRVRYGGSSKSMQSWHEAWAREAFRVAKPSAYLLAFGGTRTVHRLASAIEDAGWIIRDMLVWAYASGFPKSKASLKPAWEPIVMARKPGPLRMLAIDECRIGFASDDDEAEAKAKNQHTGYANPNSNQMSYRGDFGPRQDYTAPGRWPANVLLTDPIFDGDSPGVVGGGYQESTSVPGAWTPRGAFPIDNPTPTIYGDSGTYSRFFLIPKADRTDREPTVRGTVRGILGQGIGGTDNLGVHRENTHPTVKPVDLMRHLVRLVTPPGGLCLDPFLGSGTTAIAAELEGFRWLGIEREPEYVAIAEARLNGTQRGLGLG